MQLEKHLQQREAHVKRRERANKTDLGGKNCCCESCAKRQRVKRTRRQTRGQEEEEDTEDDEEDKEEDGGEQEDDEQRDKQAEPAAEEEGKKCFMREAAFIPAGSLWKKVEQATLIKPSTSKRTELSSHNTRSFTWL